MNPRTTKIIERMNELVKLCDQVLLTGTSNDWGQTYIEDKSLLYEWMIKSKNIIKLSLGEHSVHFSEFHNKVEAGLISISDVKEARGILKGALDDFQEGFIIGQEFVIAGEIFDSVIDEGRHLLETNHKDASAILGRVIIEDALKRIARKENLDDKLRASVINDELKKISVYSQPQWRMIQAWLDIGNSAAHGKFDSYSNEDVITMYSGIEQFLANYF